MRYIFITLLSLLGLTSQAAFNHANFAKNSRLASGRWVKVTTTETGIYEISYETLRNMGFSNPERVGLYGKGGRQCTTNFIGPTSTLLYFDDIRPVAVLHRNNKIYFYGLGTEEIRYQVNGTGYDAGAAVQRSNRNIYSSDGCYFLSDVAGPLHMEQVNSSGISNLTELTTGLGYIYHEVDLFHNGTSTGQLFYGEEMSAETPRLNFPLQLPGAIPGRKAAIDIIAYADKIKDIVMRFGFEGSDDVIESQDKSVISTDYTPFSPSLATATLPSETPTFYTEMSFPDGDGCGNIDYFVISYERSIPTLIDPDGKRMAWDHISFPRIARPQSMKIRIPDGINRIVFDVTDPEQTKIIDLYHEGSDGLAKVTNNSTTPEIVIFDPTMPQMQIKDYTNDFSEIKNQNIHAEATQGADLIIICIPQLKESAERLAKAHREKLGQRVIVASTDECYNEFSNGLPDPMAYRALIKMAYTSDYGCKNVLFMGPLYADFRGVVVEKNPKEGIIAYQSASTNTERGGLNCNDFFGIMTDYVGYNPLNTQQMSVGVGILPMRHPGEADTYVNKVEAYLDREDHAYYLNHYLIIGGVGDEDLHTKQVPEVCNSISDMSKRSVITTQLAIDAYGYDEAHQKLLQQMDDGVSMVSYFGHGAPTRLNHYGNFLNASHVYSLRNTIHPLWGFAGCELTEPDKGIRGIGESIVTSTPYGAIGSFLATRETWSSMNLDLFKIFHSNILRDGGTKSSKYYKDAMTIGQFVARTKSNSIFENELAYQLICDPAIIFPTVNRDIVLDDANPVAKPGEWTEFTGYVAAYDSQEIDPEFNGEVVVRLMEPFKEVDCPHLVLKAQKESLPNKVVTLTYADTQLTMDVAKVVDGRFTIRMMIPEKASAFSGRLGRLHLCAYDPSTRLGAATLLPAEYLEPSPETSVLAADNQSPQIERLDYDLQENSILVRVSDNVALAFDSDPLTSPFRLLIDGKEYRQGATIRPHVDHEASAYEKEIPLPDISEGSHSAKVIVRDAAGNETVAEILFDYLPSLSRYAIALEGNVVDGSGRFTTINETPANADIVIIDTNGMLIRRDLFKNGAYEWDACDSNGNPVTPGLYKAYIIETGTSNNKGHSAPINVPVI